jgi:ankyrin repeat protein
LTKAAEDGKENEARMLLEKDANVNAKDAFGWTVLHWAAVNGRLVVARLLLDNGAQVGGEDEDGWMALHFAVSQGHKAVTRLLLDRGVDPWSVDVENVLNWTADQESFGIVVQAWQARTPRDIAEG